MSPAARTLTPTPIDAESAVVTPPADPGRRSVLRSLVRGSLGLGMAALAAAGGLWTAAAGRFCVPNATSQPRNRFKAGDPAAYARGHVETRFHQRYGAWVVHGSFRGQWQLYALATACTHLGCITSWQENQQKFKCPCHGSGFTIDGIQCEGPAPRPLVRYAIRVAEDGQLEVDRSVLFREELGQWHDPRCYVPTDRPGTS